MIRAILNVVLSPLLFALVFFTPVVGSWLEVRNSPEYEVACWDVYGNRTIFAFTDPGTMRVRDGVWFYEVDGKKRIVQGHCAAWEREKEK